MAAVMKRYQDLSASELPLNFSANNTSSFPASSSRACSIKVPYLQGLFSLNSTHFIWNLSLLWNQTHFSTSVASNSKGCATEEGQHPPQDRCWHSWKGVLLCTSLNWQQDLRALEPLPAHRKQWRSMGRWLHWAESVSEGCVAACNNKQTYCMLWLLG